MLVQATARLPYLLHLSDGSYGGLELQRLIQEDAQGQQGQAYTQISLVFEPRPTSDIEKQTQLASRKAEELLLKANQLLRWYRVLTQQVGVLEVTRAQLSPIHFWNEDRSAYVQPISYEPTNLRTVVQTPLAELETQIREGLASGGEPAVATLFLLDAEAAKMAGRFREAVLFSWSTIDSVFNAKYNQLVDQELATEWSKGRDYLKGVTGEISLRVKMTAILHLLSGKSLFSLAKGNQWKDLMESYECRNGIIHRGEVAREAQADQAIRSARWLVETMASFEESAAPASTAP